MCGSAPSDEVSSYASFPRDTCRLAIGPNPSRRSELASAAIDDDIWSAVA